MKNKEKIYVIGYPKSGNTWLTRLLADLLDAKASNGMGGDDKLDLTTDYNEEILKRNSDYKYIILKNHFRPYFFLKKTNKTPERIVYIKRNIRDVIISSFFHRYKTEEKYIKKNKVKELLKNDIFTILKYVRNRLRLTQFIKNFNNPWGEKPGNYVQHIEEWKNFAKNNSNLIFTSTTYEKLLQNTEKEIRKITKDLKLKTPDQKKIKEVVKRQSFNNKKKYFEDLKKDKTIPMGKKYNLFFLRKGQTGDWENYFTESMITKINKLIVTQKNNNYEQ